MSARSPIGRTWSVVIHLVLAAYALIAIFPVLLVSYNSIKSRKAIFGQPLSLPGPETLDLSGYATVWQAANFPRYFGNSLIVTCGSLALTLLLGVMAASP